MTVLNDVWTDAIDVGKANIRSLIARMRLRFVDKAALRSAITGILAHAEIDGIAYDLDPADVTSTDDDDLVLVTGDLKRFKRAGGLDLSPKGATMALAHLEEEVTLTGASVDTAIAIPDRAIVLGVMTRTTEAVTGSTSYDCGVAAEVAKFGAALGIVLGSTNIGVIGPTPYYAATPVRLTANGGNFTGGKVRVTVFYLLFGAATS